MKNGKSKISLETYERMMEFVRIGNRAVQAAQAENHHLGFAEHLLAQRQNRL